MVWDKMSRVFENLPTSARTPGLADFHQREVGRCDSSGAKSLSPQQQMVFFSCWFFVWKQNIAKSHLLVREISCEKTHTVIGFSTGEQWVFQSWEEVFGCKKIMLKSSGVLTWCNQKTGVFKHRGLECTWVSDLDPCPTSTWHESTGRAWQDSREGWWKHVLKHFSWRVIFLWVGSCLFFFWFLFPLELRWILHLPSQVEIGRNMVGSLLIARLKTTWPAVCACCGHHHSSAITMLWCQGYHRREDRGRLPVLLPRWWSRLGEL